MSSDELMDRLEWLWKPLLAEREITVIAGRPEDGIHELAAQTRTPPHYQVDIPMTDEWSA